LRNKPNSRTSIFNWADHKISNGPVEGINNKIGTIIRAAYGIKNHDYLFTKIKFVFPPPQFRYMDIPHNSLSQRQRNKNYKGSTVILD